MDKSINEWLIDWLNGRMIEWMDRWTNSWMNALSMRNDCMNEWMNELVYKWIRGKSADLFSRPKWRRVPYWGGGRRACLMTPDLNYVYEGKRRKKKCENNEWGEQYTYEWTHGLASQSSNHLINRTQPTSTNHPIKATNQPGEGETPRKVTLTSAEVDPIALQFCARLISTAAQASSRIE